MITCKQDGNYVVTNIYKEIITNVIINIANVCGATYLLKISLLTIGCVGIPAANDCTRVSVYGPR